MVINTGCSGFLNRHWKGIFYPESLAQSKWFSFYCRHFNAIELNVTFYKFPTVKMLEGWYKKSPVDFTFAVKAPRLITHYKKLIDCSQELEDFYNTCKSGLKEKLGCLLFQFPPSFKFTQESLELVLESMDPSIKNVVEFRDLSWWNVKVYDAFRENDITFCSVNHPKLPRDIIITSSTAYVRLHGNPQIFYSSYSDEFLLQLHDYIIKDKNIKDAYVLFNNTASTAGIVNAQQFKAIR